MIRTGLIWSAVIIAMMIGFSIYGWINLHEDALIPRHWDLEGNVNAHSSRNTILLGMPAIAIFTTLFLAVIPLVDPRKENLLKSAAFYLSAWIGGIAIVGIVHMTIIYSAVTGTPPAIELVFIVVALMYLAMGNFMTKSKSNWFAGVRTPWSLSSENAWQAANRTAGWLLLTTGLATLIAIFTLPLMGMVSVMLGGTLLAVVLSIIVSYIAWRNDPAREDQSRSEGA